MGDPAGAPACKVLVGAPGIEAVPVAVLEAAGAGFEALYDEAGVGTAPDEAVVVVKAVAAGVGPLDPAAKDVAAAAGSAGVADTEPGAVGVPAALK